MSGNLSSVSPTSSSQNPTPVTPHSSGKHRVVIVGGGFGGIYTARNLRHLPVEITLIDRRNFHLFQPLLYQVATGGLSPGDIASPLRSVVKGDPNAKVVLGNVVDIDPNTQTVTVLDADEQQSTVVYDSLIVAAGARHSYFGNAAWEQHAPGLKTVEDATDIRGRILQAFEQAECAKNDAEKRAYLSFVIVGAGPTGVELAGSLGELAHATMRGEFRNIRPEDAKIYLVENSERLLEMYDPVLSEKAAASLRELGVTLCFKHRVVEIDDNGISADTPQGRQRIEAKTVLWAAGVQASPLGKILAEKTGAQLDRAGRVIVNPDLSTGTCKNIFVVGDMAHFAHQGGKPLPSVAPVAMQGGAYVAKLIKQRLQSAGSPEKPFEYFDKGSMAVIGRNKAIAQVRGLKVSGYIAWLMWIFVHIMYLVGFENRVLVFLQWASYWWTRHRGARLIAPQRNPALSHVPVLSTNPINTTTNTVPPALTPTR